LEEDDLESAVLVSVLGYVGVRPQDALALGWCHVGEKLTVVAKNVDGTIHDGSKTGTNRYLRRVELPDPVRGELEALRDRNGSPTKGPIFTVDGRTVWNENRYRNWRRREFTPAVRMAGLGRLTPYALRHTCASLMAAAGRNHLEIAHQLGHSPETSVRLYQHLIDAGTGPRRSIDEWINDARKEVREIASAKDVVE